MTDYQKLLKSIAATIADYRAGDLADPTPEHVDRWVKQFNVDVQLPILREMDHVLKSTYFSLDNVTSFLKGLLKTEKLVGSDPSKFWRSVHFLDIQEGGNSQRDMLAMFGQLLKNTCGVEIKQCGQSPESFIYLDDAIFTGNRVLRDLKTWIKTDAPANANLHIGYLCPSPRKGKSLIFLIWNDLLTHCFSCVFIIKQVLTKAQFVRYKFLLSCNNLS
ncbi:MAG: hypothetical protein WCH01_18360 [Methylococcaceae bacterium]